MKMVLNMMNLRSSLDQRSVFSEASRNRVIENVDANEIV